ncbi:MAG: hypothetical protein ACFFB5_09060 [Promethearchaeota archaeon]
MNILKLEPKTLNKTAKTPERIIIGKTKKNPKINSRTMSIFQVEADIGSLKRVTPAMTERQKTVIIPEIKTETIPVMCFLLEKLTMKELMAAGNDNGIT